MSEALVGKLLESFDKLESCITLTRHILDAQEDIPDEIFRRIDLYAEIVEKQRNLTFSLERHMANGNWAEISRHVRLINGLSSMIRDDAEDLLGCEVPGVAEQATFRYLS